MSTNTTRSTGWFQNNFELLKYELIVLISSSTFATPRHLLRESKQEHLRATRIDFYALLGLEKTAGESEIKKAYFKKSKEFHPDRWVILVKSCQQ